MGPGGADLDGDRHGVHEVGDGDGGGAAGGGEEVEVDLVEVDGDEAVHDKG